MTERKENKFEGSPRAMVEQVLKDDENKLSIIEETFLCRLRLGILPDAKLPGEQLSYLTAILLEVKEGKHWRFLKNSQKSHQWAMEIATWVNTAYLANQQFS
jgi:hypothetical protein